MRFPRPFAVTALAPLLALGLALGGCAFNAPPPPPPPVQPAPAPIVKPAPAPVAEAPIPKDIRIGLILPLSGENASLGRGLLQAAEMGLFDTAGRDVKLLVRDSAAEGGIAAAIQSLKTSEARVILGPLFGAEAKAAAPLAQKAQLPLAAFSNDRSAAAPGAYMLGIAPEIQIARVVDYAQSQGLKSVALLVPNSAYGRIVVSAAQQSLVKAGGRVAGIEFYDSATATDALRRLGAGYAVNPFDALLIPEGGVKLKAILAQLSAFGIPRDRVKLLGSGLWNDIALAGEPALQGAWFAAPAPDRLQRFESRYRQVYGQAPDPRAAIVYDAVTLAVALGKAKPGGDFTSARLTDANGFAGIAGIFRLAPNGIVERGLAILEIAPGAFVVKDPAPASFAPLTN